MFAVTFLGHQGWMVRTRRTCLLVDPILCEDFGEIHALEYRIYPPRIVRHDAFPAVDAVLLSHEHDDHFDIASLARLDRRIPIHLSGHSSAAAFRILREMGFTVHPLRPGVVLRVGDLEVIAFCGDHVNVNNADEWDALPYLIRDAGGAGSLFSMVDVAMLTSHVAWARQFVAHPGLVAWSNNALDWSCLTDRPSQGGATEQCLQLMGTDHKMIATEWGKPAAMLACAGGFTFEGARSWFNERVFAVDIDAVCAKLASMYRDETFGNAIPGQTFTMESGRLIRIEEETAFLSAAARADWPARGKRRGPGESTPDYLPATGRLDLSGEEEPRLRDAMDGLAKALVGGILFRSLHSMLGPEAGARRPTFAFVLREGSAGARRVFEYDAPACAFVPGVEGDPRDAYLAGFECWGSDLLAVLEGEMGPLALMFGRARQWNALPDRFIFDVLEGMTRMSHPLCAPREYLRNYRRLWDKSRAVSPSIRAAAA